MPTPRPQSRRISCFAFRKKRNVFDYVDEPSVNSQVDSTSNVNESSSEKPSKKEQDIARTDTRDDLTLIEPDNKYEAYDPYSTNYNPAKEKSLRKKLSSRGKAKPQKSVNNESTSTPKQTEDEVVTESDYLAYGIVDFPKDLNKTKSFGSSNFESKPSMNYHSFKSDETEPCREVLTGGRKLLIGGKLSDGKPTLESRIWDMVERRGWGMLHSSWNMMGTRTFDKVVEYLNGMEISLCLQVSKGWYKNVTDVMVMRSEVVVGEFKRVYKDKLEYDRSYILFQPVLTAKKSLRIDVIIRARVEPSCTLHKNSFGYTYSYQSSGETSNANKEVANKSDSARGKESGRDVLGLFYRKSSKSSVKNAASSNGTNAKKSIFISKFMFEVLKKNSSRTITFTRDLSSVHGEDINLAASASVCQVCEGDYIEVPITLINAVGATDVNCVKFLPMVKDVLSHIPSQLDLAHREWYTVEPNSKYLEQLFPQNIHSYSIIRPHKLLPQLVHQFTQVAGIDVITSKSSYLASNLGMVEESCNIIGHTVEVVAKTSPVICMMQKLGLQHDRIFHVQLRPGDVLQLYLTKG